MVAECEADLIRSRTKDGMRVAKAKGYMRGKQPKLNPRQEAHLIELLRATTESKHPAHQFHSDGDARVGTVSADFHGPSDPARLPAGRPPVPTQVAEPASEQSERRPPPASARVAQRRLV
jgi:hypothetical protein